MPLFPSIPRPLLVSRATSCVLVLLCFACTRPSDTPRVRASLEVTQLLGGNDTLHERAVEPREFVWPNDHGPHDGFRTEWWYFTGNVSTGDGREFGYQLTFFRSALHAGRDDDVALRADGDMAGLQAGRDGDAAAPPASAWRADHAYMAHFVVSDIASRRAHPAERFARGALGLATAAARPWHVRVEDWRLHALADSAFPVRLLAAQGGDAGVAIDLVLERGKPIVLQGERGLSRKGPEPGNASYYYSLTRMPTRGTVHIDGRAFDVQGESWLDREWSTSALGPELEGWDWFAIQLDDGTELMLYRLRRHDGSSDSFSAAIFVDVDGATRPLNASEFRLTPVRLWRSPVRPRTRYPVEWSIAVPSLGIALDAAAAFPDQELDLAVRYWEGAIRVSGTRQGNAVAGRGYLEMTGYAGRHE